MRGRCFEVCTWADVGNAVGFFESDDPDNMLPYLTRVLLAANDASIDVEACPANPAKKTTKQQRVEDSCWHTLATLILAKEPLTLSGLAAVQGRAIPVVREGVAALEKLGLVKFAKVSRLVFKTTKH